MIVSRLARRRWRIFPPVACLVATFCPTASAAPESAPSDDYWDGGFDLPPATRRSGFTFGLSGGLLIGKARGFPNELAKIDEPEFESTTGVGIRSGGTFWFGGALTDWFTFGLGASGGSLNGAGRLLGSGGAFLLHIEAFPLFYRGGAWEDLGVGLNAGIGGYTIKDRTETLAEGAGTAAVGGSLFYEPLRLWQLSMGPSLDYLHQFSQSITVNTVVVGWRTVFYGGP